MVAQLPVAALVLEVVAAQLNSWVQAMSITRCRSPPMLASLMSRSPRPVLPLALRTEGMSRRCADRPDSSQISLRASWASFVLPVCCRQVWM